MPLPESGVETGDAKALSGTFSPRLTSPGNPNETEATFVAAKPPSTTNPTATSAGTLLIAIAFPRSNERENAAYMESIKNEPILTAPSAIAHQQDGPSRRKAGRSPAPSGCRRVSACPLTMVRSPTPSLLRMIRPAQVDRDTSRCESIFGLIDHQS